MSSIPVIEPGWEGWTFSDGYLVDQEGNRYHPLAVKASFFYRQTEACKSLMYWRPAAAGQDSHHPVNQWADTGASNPESRNTDRLGGGRVGRKAHAPATPPVYVPCSLLNDLEIRNAMGQVDVRNQLTGDLRASDFSDFPEYLAIHPGSEVLALRILQRTELNRDDCV